jgi:hypothetical protein
LHIKNELEISIQKTMDCGHKDATFPASFGEILSTMDCYWLSLSGRKKINGI